MANEVWLNGRFVPYAEATVPIDDRGFQFGESLYEVIHVYSGRPFRMTLHMRRLQVGLDVLDIALGMTMEELADRCMEVVRRNTLTDALIYIQITTGSATRIHLRPEGLVPTILITASPVQPVTDDWPETGITCVTAGDERWASCYLKTTQLLANTLAKRKAVKFGHGDAIFVRDGYAVESTSSNIFAVYDGVLWTPPASNYILRGVTRAVVLEVAVEESVEVYEGPIRQERLYQADELFMTASGMELVPITAVDGRQIGSGRPGPVSRKLQVAFRKKTRGA